MFGLTQHGVGLVDSALVGVVVLVADPGIFIIIARGGRRPQFIDVSQLADSLSVIHVRDNGDVVGNDGDILVALGALRERDTAPFVGHVSHFAVVVEAAIGLIHIEAAEALLPGVFVVVPGAVSGLLIAVGVPDVLGPGQSFQGVVAAGSDHEVALIIEIEEAAAVGENGHTIHINVGTGHAIDVPDTVIVGILLDLLEHAFESFPGPGAIGLHVIDGVPIDARFFQNALVEVQALTGFGIAGGNAVHLAALGHEFDVGSVPVIRGHVYQVRFVPGSESVVRHGAADEIRGQDEQAQGSVRSAVEVDQLSGVAAPVTLGDLGDLAVVGLFDPVTIVVLGLFFFVGIRFAVSAGSPVVIDVDLSTAKVDAFLHFGVAFGRFGQSGYAGHQHDSGHQQGKEFLHTRFLL